MRNDGSGTLAHAEDLTEYLGREARSAHAEQHDVGEPVPRTRLSERAQPRQLRRHDVERVEPAEAIGNQWLNGGVVGPDVEPLPPERIGEAAADRGCAANDQRR